MKTAIIKTPLGHTKIEGDEHGISLIHILNEESEITNQIPKELKDAILQIQEYFDGKRIEFTFPLNLSGTEFQKKVWQEILKIPYGKTYSYSKLSQKLGNIKAIRAVASANGRNPIWIVVPCHRIIGSDGSLTGYAGGLWRKKWLLEHENPKKQKSLF